MSTIVRPLSILNGEWLTATSFLSQGVYIGIIINRSIVCKY